MFKFFKDFIPPQFWGNDLVQAVRELVYEASELNKNIKELSDKLERRYNGR